MNWNNNLPDEPGKYIVKTVSKYGPNDCFKNERVLESTLSINNKGEKSWSFKNQLFVAYINDKRCDGGCCDNIPETGYCIFCEHKL